MNQDIYCMIQKSILAVLYSCCLTALYIDIDIYIFFLIRDTDEEHHMVLTLIRQLTVAPSPKKSLAKSAPL